MAPTRTLLLAWLVVLGVLPTASAQSMAALRPIDCATVRIISVRGAGISVGEGLHTHRRRIWADPNVVHGSGVALGPRLIVTAAHVVAGAEHWAVIPPGETDGIAARPRFIHPSLDLAVLELDRPVEHPIRLPAARQLTLSERLSASGYPLDVRENSPAAVTGELSRVSRRGDLHLAMTVNPGNSGGPIIDDAGHLVGILSARGRVERGVEGLAIAVPLEPIREMLDGLPSGHAAFSAADREVAASIPLLLSLAEHPLEQSRARTVELVQQSLGRTEPDAEADALVASLGWNIILASLEDAGQIQVANGTPIASLEIQVIQLAQRALRNGPHVRRGFPVLGAITRGRTTVPAAPAAR